MHFKYAPQSFIAALLLATSLSAKSLPTDTSAQQESFSNVSIESESEARSPSVNLVSLLERAKKKSPKVKATSSAVKEKKAKLQKAKAARLPTIKVSSKVLQPIDKGANPKGNVSMMIDLPLLNLKTGEEINIAKIEHSLEKAKSKETKQSLYLSVIESYYKAIASLLEHRLHTQKLKSLKEQIAENKTDPMLKAAYYKQLADQQAKLTELEGHLQTLQHLTRSREGIDVDQLIHEAPTPKILSVADLRHLSRSCDMHLDFLSDVEPSMGSWLSPSEQENLCMSIIYTSPKCSKAFLEYRKAKKQWRKEKAGLYPTVKAGVSGSAEAKLDTLTNTTHNASCSVELSWSLFDGGSCNSAIAAARSAFKQKKALWIDACSDMEKQLQGSLANLEKLYISWLSTKLQLEGTKKQLLDLQSGEQRAVYDKLDLHALLKKIDFFDPEAINLSDPYNPQILREAGIKDSAGAVEFINRLDAYTAAQHAHLKVCFDIRIAYYKLANLAGLDLYELAKNPSLIHLWKKDSQ